ESVGPLARIAIDAREARTSRSQLVMLRTLADWVRLKITYDKGGMVEANRRRLRLHGAPVAPELFSKTSVAARRILAAWRGKACSSRRAAGDRTRWAASRAASWPTALRPRRGTRSRNGGSSRTRRGRAHTPTTRTTSST